MSKSSKSRRRRLIVNGDALSSLRLIAGVQAKDLAAAVGISPSYLCDIEAGRRHPRPDVASRLATALGVPVTAFCAIGAQEGESVA